MIRRKKIAKFLSNDDMVIVEQENFLNNQSGASQGLQGEGGEGEGQNDKPYTHRQIANTCTQYLSNKGICKLNQIDINLVYSRMQKNHRQLFGI